MDKNVPNHIAIIMDGNRRWAKQRGLPSTKGHEQGRDTLRNVVETAAKMGVKVLTVYALSTENIKERAKEEMSGIFSIIEEGFKNRIQDLIDNGVKVEIIGELEGLPGIIKDVIVKTNNLKIDKQVVKLNIAFNYGGKREVLSAIKKLIQDGLSADEVTDEEIQKRLYAPGEPEVDMVIRTGGKKRLSNFLLWETTYAELYFTDVLWPDFDAEQLANSIAWFGEQQRNFGK